ncbi:doublecortin domain-containing protein 2 [Boleophthalmus pectinirostris]|uniref:doublecortin domain-containing protein 2 n=1 Tax=Boleophthalmus pectinirostris TaxID=150288 RepID=UPI00242BCB86|nr:doublecortin domain-containing protein 2 [Boleophthalmus pectinirostris]
MLGELSCEELVSISDAFSCYLLLLPESSESIFHKSSHRMKTGPLPNTKAIIVYRNGDGYFVGRKIVVHPRLSTLDILLDYLSSVRTGAGQEPQFGAVRRLFTVQGLRVRRLDQVEAGGRYVAAGNESFKHLHYSEITARKPQTKVNVQIHPVVHSRIQVSSQWSKIKDGTCTIHVFTNGEVLVPPVRIRIPKYTLKSWDNVLAMVTEKVRLRSGAVYRLCTMDGRPLSGPFQLRNQQHYVAVGTEKFKALPYDQRLHYRPLSSKLGSYGGGRQSKSQNLLARVHLSQKYEKTTGGQMRAEERQLSGASSVLEGSVFAAQRRRSELAGAAEVQEDGWLSMGMPTDQVHTRLKQQNTCSHLQKLFSAQSEVKTMGEDDSSLCVQGSTLPLNMTYGHSTAPLDPKLQK